MFVFTSVMERSSRLCRGLVYYYQLLILHFIIIINYLSLFIIINHYSSLLFIIISSRWRWIDGGDVSGGYQEGVVGNRLLPVNVFPISMYICQSLILAYGCRSHWCVYSLRSLLHDDDVNYLH